MSKDVIYVGTNVSPFDRIRDYYHGAEKIGGGVNGMILQDV